MQHLDYIPYSGKKRRFLRVLVLICLLLLLIGVGVYQIPRIKRLVNYYADLSITYVLGAINSAGELPTPSVKNEPAMPAPSVNTEISATTSPEPTLTPVFTPTPTLVPTPIPPQQQLAPPAYDEVRDKQDVNNCGPATLALYLRHFGWEGNQYDISKIIKPSDDDRNVNVEELVYYVRNKTGWLNAEYRVGGDVEILKRVISAGIPVMIETTFTADRDGWPDDDRWAGHYLLVTGYDDNTQRFTVHDTWKGPNQSKTYAELDADWESFNRVYIMVYLPENLDDLKRAVGEDWDAELNRQNALDDTLAAVEDNPDNAYAWFNVGSNYTYFEEYFDAAAAYDKAREIGLPQRMLRYQFGPFIAYFNTNQNEELLSLAKYALVKSRTSEEAMLWRGWAEYRLGNNETALSFFRTALKVRPDYEDALWAIDYISAN